MRNDANLVTGLSSASYRKQVARKELEERNKQSKESLLRPHEEVIKAEIDKLRTEIADEARAAIYLEMKADDLKVLQLGAKMAESKLTSLERRLIRNFKELKSE